MPLNAQQKTIVDGFEPFDHAVGGARYLAERRRDAHDRLMVVRDDSRSQVAEDRAEARTGHDLDLVVRAMVEQPFETRVGQVLMHPTSGGDGEDLHPEANSERRNAAFEHVRCEREFRSLTARVHRLGARMQLDAARAQVDVVAAAQHDSVDAFEQHRELFARRRRQNHRNSARAPNGLEIGEFDAHDLGRRRLEVATDGDDGFHELRMRSRPTWNQRLLLCRATKSPTNARRAPLRSPCFERALGIWCVSCSVRSASLRRSLERIVGSVAQRAVFHLGVGAAEPLRSIVREHRHALLATFAHFAGPLRAFVRSEP